MPSQFEESKIYFTPTKAPRIFHAGEWSAKFASIACCASMTIEIQLDTASVDCLYVYCMCVFGRHGRRLN